MIRQPNSPELQTLASEIRSISADSGDVHQSNSWPSKQLQLCADAGFYRWFVSTEDGGFGWSASDIAKGYLELSSACLTTTFVLTQRIAAIRRIAGCENVALRQRMLSGMLDGSRTATVGISHLTTSRRHLKKPALTAVEHGDGFQINGFSPWVTGGLGADFILMGAQVVTETNEVTDEQVLFVAKSNANGVAVQPGQKLVALSGTQTGSVTCDNLLIPSEDVLAGPAENVLVGNGGGAGGLQTSVLALGLVKSAIEFMEVEATKREELASAQTELRAQYDQLCSQLFAAADVGDSSSAATIRTQANSLALRATQAALVAAKGSGFVEGHPVGRWCTEALFFLVWSCPQNVAQANLADFATCTL